MILIAPEAAVQSKPQALSLHAPKRMLYPGLANLFKALIVARSTAHAIQILRMTGWSVSRHRQQNPLASSPLLQVIRRQRQTYLGPIPSQLDQPTHIPPTIASGPG